MFHKKFDKLLVFRFILDDEAEPHSVEKNKDNVACRGLAMATISHSWLVHLSNNGRSGHQCAQTPPLPTWLTARHIWDKTEKGFHEICQI